MRHTVHQNRSMMVTELALGFAVGAIMALTGAGGGILAVPVLMFGLQLNVSQAGPVGLMAVGLAATLGAAAALPAGTVRYRAAILMSVSGMLLSPLGIWLSHRTDGRWLAILFSLLLFFVAYRSFRHARKQSQFNVQGAAGQAQEPTCLQNPRSGRFVWTARCMRALVLAGGIAGFFSGLLGVGSGFIIVPALQHFTGLAMQSVIATSLTVIALVSWTGVLFNYTSGSLDMDTALPFCTGAMAGMLAGRFMPHWLTEFQVQISFAVLSAVVATGMLLFSFA
ncbi:putative membrane transporter protein [Candidatus Nitrotoga fabula]|uniref:Probable membrane transporter protein n=2 Tax=Candidatus Nitrotoga fabula TaxID=2182327 RepID=A0A916F9C8_9PROT|nr:putative membrane transporter protein [Candidatus Nitrotoga fabula]